MGKVNRVEIIPKLELKTAAEVVAAIRPFFRRLVVCDIGAISEPPNVFLLRLLQAVKQRFHSLRVVGVAFHKIANVELVSLALLSIHASEKVPLSISLCSVVSF